MFVGSLTYGLRQTEHGWLRFTLGAGADTYVDSSSNGPLVQARAGYEARACTRRRIACAYVGIDGAAFYGSHSGDSANGDPADRFVGFAAVPRIGVELGVERLALRLGAEGALGTYDMLMGPSSDALAFEVALTGGFAYRW